MLQMAVVRRMKLVSWGPVATAETVASALSAEIDGRLYDSPLGSCLENPTPRGSPMREFKIALRISYPRKHTLLQIKYGSLKHRSFTESRAIQDFSRQCPSLYAKNFLSRTYNYLALRTQSFYIMKMMGRIYVW